MKEHGTVTVTDFNQQRRRHILHVENGRIADVRLQILIQRNLHALLAGFDMIGLGNA